MTEVKEYILKIDKNLRSIQIPDEVAHIGVESDDGVNHIRFRLPQKYDGYDLSTFTINVNYVNAHNEGDIYVAESPTVQNGFIFFDWIIGRHACKYKGNVTFSVCLKKMDDDVVVQEFNTMTASLPVLEGLETSEAVEEEVTDIVDQLVNRSYTKAEVDALIPDNITVISDGNGNVTLSL